MSINRRQYFRLAVDVELGEIDLRGQTYQGVLLEESIGGLKIGGLELVNLVRGDLVTFRGQRESYQGLCRSVARDDQGLFSIGIERAENSTGASTKRMLVNSYIFNEGYHFVCYPELTVNSENTQVTLWNEHQLIATKQQLCSFTEVERREYLESPDYLHFVATAYGKMPNLVADESKQTEDNVNQTLVQEILDFEF